MSLSNCEWLAGARVSSEYDSWGLLQALLCRQFISQVLAVQTLTKDFGNNMSSNDYKFTVNSMASGT